MLNTFPLFGLSFSLVTDEETTRYVDPLYQIHILYGHLTNILHQTRWKVRDCAETKNLLCIHTHTGLTVSALILSPQVTSHLQWMCTSRGSNWPTQSVIMKQMRTYDFVQTSAST